MRNLDSIFYPRSIAVIGASRHPGSVGHSLLANLIDSRFKGILYPVNPKADGILGIKTYPSVDHIPDPVDLAVVMVPAPIVAPVLRECGEAGIKGAVVISAGFKEIGGEGMEKEREVKAILKSYDMALVGPNCLGVMNTAEDTSLNATFGTELPKPGNIAFLSQSGALCVAVLDYAKESNVGFSKFISMGNKAGITENDLLVYLKEDRNTDVILMYLEDLVDGRRFMDIARDITTHSSHPKPVIALKAGRTLLGARAVASHTGSLAGSDRVYDAIFEQSGVLRSDTLDAAFDLVKAFSSQPLPKKKSVVIVTNSGGPGILATDSFIKNDMSIARVPRKIKQRLKSFLPPNASLNNPIDLIAEAQETEYERTLDEMLTAGNVGGALVILTPTAFTRVERVAEAIVRTAERHDKPVLCCFLGVYDVSKGLEILENNGIPTYRFPESAAKVLSEMSIFADWLKRPKTGIRKFRVETAKAGKIVRAVKEEGRDFLMEHEAYGVLEAYGFPVVPHELAVSEAHAVRAAERMGFPVVLKIASTDIVHKFDFGGVKLGIRDKAAVRRAYKEIIRDVAAKLPEARISGVLVERMVTGGKEIILGMNRDPQFGPILMFGMGGIYVEVLEDVSFRLAPIRERTARIMISRTKTHKILDGFRGEPPYDIPAVEDCLKRLSQLVTEIDDIKELDINPLIVYERGRGCAALDARIIL